jgi:peroxisomal enoyl-CoA hydratase 2
MDKTIAGKSFAPYEFRVERGKIKEFADAVGDPNPLYRDPVVAAQAGFAGIPAPPTLLRTFLYETSDSRNALGVKDWSYIVHGEQEFEYLAPVVAGDVLSAQDRVVSIAEKESKRAGTLQIAVIETVFKNQRGETVQIARRTLVETGKRISE